jgi:hypothetical protein
MRTVKWNAFLSCLCGFAVVLGGVAMSARADVTTEKGAAVLVFPKVRADGVFDTVIQIANLSTMMVHARCFYVNATLQDALTQLPCEVPSATCVPLCQETDFEIWLTARQPTHWSVSTGRRFTPYPTFGEDDSGFAPGHVPPMSDFVGELKCVEVYPSGQPMNRNDLKGEATLVAVATTGSGSNQTAEGDIAKYNAVGIRVNADAVPSNPLLLDGGTTYDACPSKLILNHVTSGAPDMLVSELQARGMVPPEVNSAGYTDLTLVPCTENFENQIPKSVTVQFLIYNEFEEVYSTSTTVSCFLETELTNIGSGQIFSYGVLGTDVAHTVITPVVQQDGSSGGLVGIAERITTLTEGANSTAGRAAYNLHGEGSYVPQAPEPPCDPGVWCGPPDSITMSAQP